MKSVAPYRLSCRGARPGFTFTEVLFAMMIMGVGFIMLAAMFPVALRQVQANMEDSAGAAIGQSAVRMIGQFASANPANPGYLAPTGGTVTAFSASQTNAIRYNQIGSFDQRYAWVGLYSRAAGDDFARVYVFSLMDRNSSAYSTSSNLSSLITATPATIGVTYGNGTAPSTATVSASQATPGAFVVVAATGNVYRLGSLQAGSTTTFYLVPGFDALSSSETGGSGYIVGAGMDASGNYTGGAQDIGFYAGAVPLY